MQTTDHLRWRIRDRIAERQGTVSRSEIACIKQSGGVRADLTGTDITDKTNFTKATYDRFTTFPTDFDPTTRGLEKR